MPVSRRIADALSDPQRAWSFGRNVARLLIRRELKTAWSRLRPRSFDADEYRRWISMVEPAIPLPQVVDPPPWLLLLDARNAAPDVLARIIASVAGIRSSQATATVRTDDSGWTTPFPLDCIGDALRPGASRSALGDVIASWKDHRVSGWVMWLSEPACIAPSALIALSEAARSDASLAYGDDDRLDASGRRCDPSFRAAWDIELGRAGHGLGPLIAMPVSMTSSQACLDAVETGDGCGWALSVAAHADAASIIHVPRVLAHRMGEPAKSERRSQAAQGGLDGAAQNARIRKRRLASLVIPSRNRPDLLRRCIASIIDRTTHRPYEFIFVDNDSTDPDVLLLYRETLALHPGRIVHVAGEFNYPRLCNAGASAASGELLVMLNNDTEVVTPGWLDELADVLGTPDVGAAGALLQYENGRIQHAGILLGVNGSADNALANFGRDDPVARAWCASRRTVSAVLGACLAIRSDVYRNAGGMDEAFAVSHNEIDLCLRLSDRGLRTVFTPHAILMHAESATRGYDLTREQRAIRNAESALFAQRWRERLAVCDPAYHPVLSSQGSQFRLASDPTLCVPRRRAAGGRACLLS
jgi:GT2 family glycosyltransferase